MPKVMKISGFIIGCCCWNYYCIFLFSNHSFSPVKLNVLLILLLLYSQLLLGLGSIFVSAGHTDGAEMLLLMSWAQNIATFDPAEAAAAILSVHWIYKLHVFLGMSLFIVFPFSRLVHIASVPVKYLGRNYQVVRKKAWR